MMQRIGLLSFWVLACGCAHTPKAQPVPEAVQAQAQPQAPVMQVVPLKYASADELCKVILQVLGGPHRRSLRIVADPRTNSLILTGDGEADLAGALELIAKLDVEAPKGH
jgi:type II secretory pathway component GspD/PulD (secretin)